jgi:DNA polymerase
MRRVVLPRIGTVAAWRAAARGLAAADVPGEAVLWQVEGSDPDLFQGDAPPLALSAPGASFTLARAALGVIEEALCHADPGRFALAYGLVRDLGHGRVRWGDRSDPAMRRLLAMAKTVARDIHKMHAFVRFRELPAPGPRRRFAAWFEPAHPITEAAAPFFARRFGDMDWAILTPAVTALFDAGRLSFRLTDGAGPAPADATEDLWRTYYASIFNPARLMTRAMMSEMPKRYWNNLPEADLIPGLVRDAGDRVRAMQAAAPAVPPTYAAALARQRGARG